ncbi:MAG TPA: lmo0937 family membrane protein [Terriglobia bacterium]|nr:lmo0937 family membrane protein [Terriglobia bacterium]
MLLGLFVILLIAWIFGFIVFHVASALIHILIILAIISLIVHLIRGRGHAT